MVRGNRVFVERQQHSVCSADSPSKRARKRENRRIWHVLVSCTCVRKFVIARPAAETVSSARSSAAAMSVNAVTVTARVVDGQTVCGDGPGEPVAATAVGFSPACDRRVPPGSTSRDVAPVGRASTPFCVNFFSPHTDRVSGRGHARVSRPIADALDFVRRPSILAIGDPRISFA